ncbi:Hypothetical protein PHPALM_6726 [Phytophthora palmivora]|uniref:Uncharacterized protein n=1 Tax=Phytophthora palmivora TaxID=4796 RepID=A0A2P4YE36_9STRA|nr:Hypothetical protein PHPALM_6726 [Phytophthora palmivora]
MVTTHYYYLKPGALGTSGFAYCTGQSMSEAEIEVERLPRTMSLPLALISGRKVSEQATQLGLGTYIGSSELLLALSVEIYAMLLGEAISRAWEIRTLEPVRVSGAVPLLHITSFEISQVSVKYALDFVIYHDGGRRAPLSI